MNEEIKNGSKSKACVSFLWTLVPLCFDPRVKWKKKVLKFVNLCLLCLLHCQVGSCSGHLRSPLEWVAISFSRGSS